MFGFDALQERLTLVQRNLSEIGNNIANVNTPNYKRKYVDFQSMLDDKTLSMNISDERHLKGNSLDSGAAVISDKSIRVDNNGVDINNEINELSKNNLYYQSLTRILSNDLNIAKTIITSK